MPWLVRAGVRGLPRRTAGAPGRVRARRTSTRATSAPGGPCSTTRWRARDRHRPARRAPLRPDVVAPGQRHVVRRAPRVRRRARHPAARLRRDHYDVPSEYYDAAVAAGAVPVTSRDLVVMLVRAGLRRGKNAASRRGGLMRGRENKDATTDRWERNDWWGVTLEAPDPPDAAAVLVGGPRGADLYSRRRTVARSTSGECVGSFSGPEGRGLRAPVWPPEPGKQGMQIHLEIEVTDLAAAVEHAIELGATQAEHQPQDDVRVMLDPARSPVLPLQLSQLRLDVGAGGGPPSARGRGRCGTATAWPAGRAARRRGRRNRSSGTWAYSWRTSATYSA